MRVLAQSPAVETGPPTQQRLFLHLHLSAFDEPSRATKLPNAACAFTLRLMRSKRALEDECGNLGRSHALLARLEAEVISECRTLGNGGVLAREELMHLVHVPDSDSLPTFRDQDIAIS